VEVEEAAGVRGVPAAVVVRCPSRDGAVRVCCCFTGERVALQAMCDIAYRLAHYHSRNGTWDPSATKLPSRAHRSRAAAPLAASTGATSVGTEFLAGWAPVKADQATLILYPYRMWGWELAKVRGVLFRSRYVSCSCF
jgi:hypothetical protein